MIDYKEINQRNREIATKNATPEEKKLRKEYGRIFHNEHGTQQHHERKLEIRKELVRKRLIELERFPAFLFDEEKKILALITPIRKKDWIALTVFEVDGIADAKRKAKNENYQLMVF